jgi:hypothetical protein
MTPSQRLIVLLAVAAGATAAAVPAAAQVAGPSDSAIRAILRERIESKRAIGIVAATLDHGRSTIYTAGSSGGKVVRMILHQGGQNVPGAKQ